MANPKPGSFVHIEIASTDPERTKKFFEDVFEWDFEGIPEMNYHTYEAPSPPHGGLMSPMENQRPGILNYLLSHSIDEDIKKIESAGGHILLPKMEIPGVGWWASFEEPTGIVLALFEAKGGRDLPERRRARTARKSTKAKRARKGSRAGRRRR